MKHTADSEKRGSVFALLLAFVLFGACLSWAQGDNAFAGMGGEDLPAEDVGKAASGDERRQDVDESGVPDAAAVVDNADGIGGNDPADASPTDDILDNSLVSFPAAQQGRTILDALRIVAKEAGRTLRILSTNGLESLDAEYAPPEEGADVPRKFMSVMRDLLPDDEFIDVWSEPDVSNRKGRCVFLGTSDAVSRWMTQYDVQRLDQNHARISFETSKGGMTIYDAVLRIAKDSGANILVNFMAPEDQVTEDEDDYGDAATAPATVDMVAGAVPEDKVSKARRVPFYSTYGQEVEWRTVLGSVIEPDYAFDEKDGKVRVMLKEELRRRSEQERNAVSMEIRYVRVYHANPEDVVAKLKALGVTENGNAKIEVAPYVEKGGNSVPSYRHNLSSSSTSLSTGNSQIGDSGSSSSSSWGNLMRPKNPPAILLYDNPGNLDKLEALVRKLDVREKQILIEAMLLSLTDDGSRRLGMKLDEMGFGNLPIFGVNFQNSHDNNHSSSSRDTWTSTDDRHNDASRTIVRNDGSDFRMTPDPLNNGKANYWTSEASVTLKNAFSGEYLRNNDSARNRTFSSVLGPLNFSFILEMVQEDKFGKLLSSPVITVGDHSEAMVHVGKVIPILKIETDVQAASVNSVVVEEVDWMELVTGIMMWVGPEVTEDGNSVRLWVHPRISEVDGDQWEHYKEMRYPHLVSEEIDTRVTVPSGDTLLLGGLTRTSESETIKRIPLLGDIPLLGRLFRWTSRSTSRENLVILIRPTVLDDEKPNTEFEAPAMKIVDPMMEGSGRTLVDVAFKDEDDPMKRREKAILTAVGLKTKDDVSSTDDVAEESDGTDEQSDDIRDTSGDTEDDPPEGKGEEPSITVVVPPSAESDEDPAAEPAADRAADDLAG